MERSRARSVSCGGAGMNSISDYKYAYPISDSAKHKLKSKVEYSPCVTLSAEEYYKRRDS